MKLNNTTFLYNIIGAEKDITEMYSQRITVATIAEKWKVTPRTIQRIVKKYGLTRGPSTLKQKTA